MAWGDILSSGFDFHPSDATRFRQAFQTLAKTRRAWPAPADFVEALPARVELKALPAVASDPERAAQAIQDARKALGLTS